MFFSVLIPVYNVQKYLRECVESVLAQTEQDFEIVLVDDGSTDESGIICDYYEKEYPNLIKVYHQENQGLIMARRKAVKEARGTYFVFLDSDDMLRPTSLQVIKDTIKLTQCDMTIYGYVRLGINGEERNVILNCVENSLSKQSLCRYIVEDNRINNIWIKCVHRSIVDIETDYSPWKEITIGEDILQSLPLITNAEKIVYIPKSLYVYRKNNGSMTMQKSVKQYDSLKVVLQEMKNYIFKWGLDKELIQSFEKKYIHMCCDCISSAGVSKSAKKDKKMFSNLVCEISQDVEFRECYKNVKNLKMHEKILAVGIYYRIPNALELYLKGVNLLLKIRSK